jgi:hypothetical protein
MLLSGVLARHKVAAIAGLAICAATAGFFINSPVILAGGTTKKCKYTGIGGPPDPGCSSGYYVAGKVFCESCPDSGSECSTDQPWGFTYVFDGSYGSVICMIPVHSAGANCVTCP